MGYLPLDALKQIRKELIASTCYAMPQRLSIKELFKKAINANINFQDEEEFNLFIDYILYDLFECSEKEIPQKYVSVSRKTKEVISLIKGFYKSIDQVKSSNIKDELVFPYLLGGFEETKRVYKPSPIFAKTLLTTANLTIFKDDMEKLPCNSFYIDLSDCTFFHPFEGCFVFASYNNGVYSVSVHPLAKVNGSVTFWSSYSKLFFPDETQPFSVKTEDLINNYNKGDSQRMVMQIKENEITKTMLSEDSFVSLLGAVAVFTFQMICYLGSKEPDLVPQPRKPIPAKQKELIKKTRSVELLFKEQTNIINVGNDYDAEIKIRFGKYLNPKTYEFDYEKLEKGSAGQRKPLTPHMRSAHWHTYCCGKDKKDRIVHWQPPIFVRGNIAQDVTVQLIN